MHGDLGLNALGQDLQRLLEPPISRLACNLQPHRSCVPASWLLWRRLT